MSRGGKISDCPRFHINFPAITNYTETEMFFSCVPSFKLFILNFNRIRVFTKVEPNWPTLNPTQREQERLDFWNVRILAFLTVKDNAISYK